MNYGYQTAGGGYMQTELLGYGTPQNNPSPSGNTGAAWMQGVSGAFGLAGSILGIYERNKAYKAEARGFAGQADSLMNQAALYGKQADMYAAAAGAYAASGRQAEAIGRANAAETMRQSTQLDVQMQYQLQAVNKERRAKIGEGLAAFAANGVLVEGRDGAATAMWERDEMADAAVEKLAIQQSFENEYYNYRIKAKGQIVEGLLAKANYYGQAASASMQSWASKMQRAGAIEDALAARSQAAASRRKGKFSWADAIGIGSQVAGAAASVAMFL